MTTSTMSPSRMIAQVDTLAAYVDDIASALRAEIKTVSAQWQQLGRIGAQREDHAAALLAQLSGHLADLERLARNAQEQIKQMNDNPFRE